MACRRIVKLRRDVVPREREVHGEGGAHRACAEDANLDVEKVRIENEILRCMLADNHEAVAIRRLQDTDNRVCEPIHGLTGPGATVVTPGPLGVFTSAGTAR